MSLEVDTSLSSLRYRPPKTRQRVNKSPPALSIPDINDDASERKRVLNVLAQRRYRERKRQSKKPTSKAPIPSDTSDSPAHSNHSSTEDPEQSFSPDAYLQIDALSQQGSSGYMLANATLSEINKLENANLQAEPCPHAAGNMTSQNLLLGSEDPQSLDISQIAGSQNSNLITTDFEKISTSGFTMDPSALLDSSGSPSSMGDWDNLSFPDSYHLPVNELTLLKALLRIASRIRCNSSLWDLTAASPFTNGTHMDLSTEELPLTWRPTATQKTTPHHPVIDMIPWPGVRDRILLILAMPEEARPPSAAGPMALVRIRLGGQRRGHQNMGQRSLRSDVLGGRPIAF
ncbi:hypothetical protein F5Y15DRAFT_205493 [Xylariaceae sp. FL0016]|nr:hypothetical protein F5Y15DRAFT_205493 [Xylariaceae sp. FL0016]